MGTPSQPRSLNALTFGSASYNTTFYYGSSDSDGPPRGTVAPSLGFGSIDSRNTYWSRMNVFDAILPNAFTDYDSLTGKFDSWGWFFAGNDNTTLTRNSDFISLGQGDDTFTIQNDTWTPWGGTDYVFGGSGSDRGYLPGRFSDYLFDFVTAPAKDVYGTSTYSFTKFTLSGKSGDLYLNGVEEVFFVGEQRTYTISQLFVPTDIVLPSITLAVSPASVLEDGSTNLVYTFTRTGATTNALTVNYGITGTADSTDYTGATPGTGKTITFAAGASTAMLTIDPSADTTIEADETVALTLATGTGYTVGTASAVVGTISNDDKLIPAYTVTPSAGTINEGATLTTTVATTNVGTGTTLYWSIGGTGVTAADFSSGALTGSGVVGTDGEISFVHTAANDLTTEGDETLQIMLFADSALTTQVGSTATVTVKDTSLTSTKPTQKVYTDKSEIMYKPTGIAALPLLYTTSTGDANLSGLTLNIHYNSSILTPSGSSNGVSGQVAVALSSSTIMADTNNSDNDPLTDKIVQLVWATFDNSFPNNTLPIAIATVSFETSATKKDLVTGQLLNTTVRYTAAEAAPNYDFLTGSTTFKAQQFNLDVDGDGKVTALGDGLMVIRHLFGSAFSGSALTDKAISPTSPLLGGGTYNTMTAEQKTQVASLVATNIQQGIDAGLLDVDKDGRTTALGDGLMVIRNLFGSAFSGTALIDKAISPTSPFLGGLTYATMNPDQKLAASGLVTANIDALKPTLI